MGKYVVVLHDCNESPKYGYYYFKIEPKRVKEVIENHRRLLERILGKKVKVNEKVLEKVIDMLLRYGLPYCPCRLERNKLTICPCVYHFQELIEKGRCKCGLFEVEKNE